MKRERNRNGKSSNSLWETAPESRAERVRGLFHLNGVPQTSRWRMARKSESRKKRNESALTPEELMELQMILDRISVQVAEGESFQVYLVSLRKLLEHRERMVAELLSELSRNPSPVGFKVFGTLSDIVTEKGLCKRVRQAAYRFARKGFVLVRAEKFQEPVVLVQRERKKTVAHLAMGPGTLWFLSGLVPSDPSGLPVLFMSYFEAGYHKLVTRLAEGSNRFYRELLATLAGAMPGTKPCEVPVWHAARLFSDMIAFCEAPADSPGAEELTGLLTPFSEPERLPYIYELMPPIDSPLERLRTIKPEVLLEKVDALWLFFPREELEPWHAKLLDLEHSVLFVAEDVRRAQVDTVMREAMEALCVGRRRLLLQRSFEEHALWWKAQGADDLAEGFFAVARHLSSEARASENPAVRLLLSESMSHYWPEEIEGRDEPGEEVAEPFYRTESGLFVPR